MRYRRALIAATLLLAAGCAQPPSAAITVEELRGHVEWLADDARAGRGTGTPESRQVAEYCAKQMEAAGLQPAGDHGGWYQEFEVAMPAEPGPCSLLAPGLKLSGEVGTIAAAKSGKVKGAVDTAGYGGGPPMQGKIALLRRYGPPETQGSMEEDASALRRKLKAAEEAGAIGVILGTAPGDLARGGADTLAFSSVPGEVGIPVITLNAKDFGLLEATVLVWSGPYEVEIGAQVKHPTARAWNVLGLVPGNGPELIVVGGHYDHLGMGGPDSLAPGVHAVHNGADDNASGTAVVLELAEQAGARGAARGPRGLLFACWAAEEMGLLGSEWWVKHPTVPIERVVANLNLDMVGRAANDKITVGSAETAAAFRPALEAVQKDLRAQGIGLELNVAAGALPGGGGSDHMSFHQAGIPALFFFSGLHPDYHKPSDDADKIDYPRMVEVAAAVTALLARLELADRGALAYVKPEAPAGGAREGRRPGLWFGSIPDYAAAPEGGGMQIAGTSPGSPAEKAGLKEGDVIRKVGDFAIGDIYDFMDALAAFKVGDTVSVTVLRAGKLLTLQLTFFARPTSEV